MTDGVPELLRSLDPEDAQKALSLGSRMTIASGSVLFHLGAEADRLFLVQRGRVKLTLPMQVRGRQEDVFVEERFPGQTVGWSALIPPYRFTLKATALLETELIVLSREALRELFASHPSIGCVVSLNLAAVIGQRLQLFQTMWLREMERMVELRCA